MREHEGWNSTPYQWAAAGYMGAIKSGNTICGALAGGAIYFGFLNSIDTTDAPELKDGRRISAIESVENLFNGFNEKFGSTNCRTLTGCDWRNKEDVKKFLKQEGYKNTCFPQYKFVIENCLSAKTITDKK